MWNTSRKLLVTWKKSVIKPAQTRHFPWLFSRTTQDQTEQSARCEKERKHVTSPTSCYCVRQLRNYTWRWHRPRLKRRAMRRFVLFIQATSLPPTRRRSQMQTRPVYSSAGRRRARSGTTLLNYRLNLNAHAQLSLSWIGGGEQGGLWPAEKFKGPLPNRGGDGLARTSGHSR